MALLAGCADIVVLTECDESMPLDGQLAYPADRWEVEAPPFEGARKVAMWSRLGWTDVDESPIAAIGGRCVVGRTNALTVVGVCIPWHDAGKSDKQRWQLHEEFLSLLRGLLWKLEGPVVVAGDFNQRRPTTFVPERLVTLMDDVFAGHPIATLDDPDRIDHVAVSQGLAGKVLKSLPKRTPDDKKISDHTGVVVEITPDRAGG